MAGPRRFRYLSILNIQFWFFFFFSIISAQWRKIAALTWVAIALDNGLAQSGHQAKMCSAKNYYVSL